MKLDQIILDPNTRYKAVAELHISRTSKATISSIKLKTDNNGEVVEFSDGLLRDKSGKLITQDFKMAEVYDYLQLENIETGRIINLKLHTAAAKGNIHLANEAFSEKHDIDLRIKQGATPLHWASAHGHIEIVRLLVEHGADINITDDWGWTPILLAANHGHIKIVKFLKDNGAIMKGIVNGKELFVNL